MYMGTCLCVCFVQVKSFRTYDKERLPVDVLGDEDKFMIQVSGT